MLKWYITIDCYKISVRCVRIDLQKGGREGGENAYSQRAESVENGTQADWNLGHYSL